MEQEQHDGELLERTIREQQKSTSTIARELSVNRKTLYNWFAKPELPRNVAIKVGSVIGIDLITQYPAQFTGDRPFQANIPERVKAANENSVKYWKEKYFDLLPKYTALLEDKVGSRSGKNTEK